MLFWLPFVFFVVGNSVYQEYFSQDLTCVGRPTVKYVSNRACSVYDIQSVCINFINITGSITTCPEVVVLPPNWASVQVWASSLNCSGLPDFVIATPPNECTGYWEGPTVQLDCERSRIRECLDLAATCGDCPAKEVNANGMCHAGTPIQYFPMASYIFTCPQTCRHHELP
jgi:hypothetical protein